MQKHVSRRLPRSEQDFDRHALTGGVRHLEALDRVRPGIDRSALHCYEFGAGWDLIGAICMWPLAVDRQTVVDINPNLGLDLVNDTIHRFATDADQLERLLGARLRRPDDSPMADLTELATRFGITYLAPQDARAMPSGGRQRRLHYEYVHARAHPARRHRRDPARGPSAHRARGDHQLADRHAGPLSLRAVNGLGLQLPPLYTLAVALAELAPALAEPAPSLPVRPSVRASRIRARLRRPGHTHEPAPGRATRDRDRARVRPVQHHRLGHEAHARRRPAAAGPSP